MKSFEDVIRFVDEMFLNMLERPQMYASSPEALEDVLMTLEKLRGFILGDGLDKPSAYTKFLLAHGFGVAKLTGQEIPTAIT